MSKLENLREMKMILAVIQGQILSLEDVLAKSDRDIVTISWP